MKKTILGFGVLVIYGIYSLGIRHQAPILNKPSSLASNNAAPTNTSASSSSANASNAAPTSNQAPATSSSALKDGTYTGSIQDAYYGNVQVSVNISGGKITNVKFLQYPNSHSTSVYINQQAMPYLKQEAIQAQSSNVQVISGATFTSQAFIQSMQSALSQA